MRNFKISRKFKDCFIINDTCLKGIFEVLKSYYDKVEINAICEGGLTISTDNINDILEHENMNQNKFLIVSFSAKKNTDEYVTTEKLNLEIKSPVLSSMAIFDFDSIFLEIESQSEKDINYLSGKIEKYINECRPCYNYLATKNYFDILLYCIILSVFLVLVVLIFFSETYIYLLIANFIISLGSPIYTWVLVFVMYGILVLAFPPVSIFKKARKLNNFIFPKLFFVIGKQKDEYEKIEQIRNIFFVGIILTFIIGLVVNWVSTKIF